MAQVADQLTRELPPVFVMNLYYTGIGIARNLHGFGVDVFGLSSERDAPGLRSRFFQRNYMVPNSRDEPVSLCEKLLVIRNEHAEAPVIFPTRDADVLFLKDHAVRLGPHYRLPPTGQGLALLMDKLQLADIAEQQGIPVPCTVVCSTMLQVEEAGRELRFPVVIKPRSAHQWRKSGVWEKVGARKAILVRTPNELVAEYAIVATVSEEVLLQEYIAGGDADIVVCCCYIAPDGRWLGHFTARKLRQNPPLFGTGCLVEATPVSGIVELSQRLLKACGYSGLAEIEFKQDRTTGTYYLIEVNPRHWDQHELGKLVGVNLSWIAYQDSIGRRLQPVLPVYRSSGTPRWIAEREALFLIAKNVSAGMASAGKGEASISRAAVVRSAVAELVDLLRRPRLFSILSVRDPLPGVLFLSRLLREVFMLAMTRKNRKHS